MTDLYLPTGYPLQIFNERYAFHSDETYTGMANRVSTVVAGPEPQFQKWNGYFLDLISSGDFVPGGRIMHGAGRPVQQMINCFVTPTGDSREDWGRMVSENIIIAGTGGGNGENYGLIRPRGSLINGVGGIATGPVSVMRIENGALKEIRGGGGRRAARMGTLPYNHPDIVEFIHAKIQDGSFENFNLSVWFQDDPEVFFNLVREDADLALMWRGQVHSTISARMLWDMILTNALKNGEPGLLNGYLANKMNNILYAGREIVCTNPCVTGDTVIATLEGPKTFIELEQSGKDVQVYSWHPKTKKPVVRWMRNPRVTRKNARILEVQFDSGLSVRCTADHNFYSFRGNKVMAQDLKIGSSVRAFSMSKHRDGHLRVHGWDSDHNAAAHQWVARMVWECENGPVPEGMIIHHLDENKLNNHISNLAAITPLEHNSEHYADRVLGGFHHPQEDRSHAINRVTNHKVTAIKEAGHETVYNGTVDDAHTYIILDPHPVAGELSGIVSANCGEIPMHPYSNCCLGAVVLPAMVKKGSKARDPKDRIDWERLHHAVSVGTRFLDNVLTVSHYPFERLKVESMETRRLGLGIMGLHYFLLDLGLKYSSQEARDLCDKVGTFIKNTAYQTSVGLAQEKGMFPLCDPEKIIDSGFIRTLKPSVRNAIRQHGLRNCALLTIAPTGTGAIVREVSSALEPIFAEGWLRKHKQGEHIAQTIVVDRMFKDMVLEGRDVSMFEGASDIHPRDHLAMQVVWQKHIDNAVSKTINMPQASYTKETLSEVYMEFLPQLKGLTIFPEGSREDAPLTRLSREMVMDHILVGSATEVSVEADECPTGLCTI